MAKTRFVAKFPSALDTIIEKLGKPAALRVGFLEKSKYPDGTYVAMVAAIQNYGAPQAKIPPRPFFSNMVAEKKGEWPKAIADLLIANDYDVWETLQTTGQTIVGQLQQSIRDTNSPPLADSTLARRGVAGMKFDPTDPSTYGAKPLIHTSLMINSAAFEIKT